MKPRIVILGAGFGGVYVGRRLKRLAKKGLIDLTIVNRTNYFLFTPLLHEVATGGLGPRNVAEPLRQIFRDSGTKIVQAEIRSIDPEKRLVTVSGEQEDCIIPYDYLVLASGAETNYYGIPGAKENTLPLKTLWDAIAIRSRIIDAFELGVLAKSPDELARDLSFIVVGGGATGVEAASELAEFVREMKKKYFRKAGLQTRVSLIHTGKELLEMFAPKLRLAAEKRLRKNKVDLLLGRTVVEASPSGLKMSDGTTVEAGTVIWAAGVKATAPAFVGTTPALSGGRLVVDQYFRLQMSDRIFVLGDAAAYVDAHEFQKDSAKTRPVPMLAQAAVAQSRAVAHNVIASIRRRPLRNFHFESKGSMVSVGQWFAIGEIYSLHIAGSLAWWIWRTVYLFKFASWQKRIRIAIDWTINSFYPRDITKLT
ncbi:NAD(P)/FAD-dependent oxidoreductase [Patescibacteria group bacterium]|nr:NAD(P)/FAD-dependent oxidoreductase [Patescibacteria group bacterium]